MQKKHSYRLEFTYSKHTTIDDDTFIYVLSAMKRIISDFCYRFKIEWKITKIDNGL